MAVLINGMEMPTSCEKCEFHDGWCLRLPGIVQARNERREDCPLVPVPPHGRLIDADAILQEATKGEEPFDWIDKNELLQLFFDAPTIIPAEEGET